MKKQSKQKALRRLRIIEGQVRGLGRMVEEEKYCVDIITQSEAVKEALSGVENVILENHLSTHVRHQMRTGRDAQAIKEIIEVYKLAQRKK
jgi:DNA-binding FrmR family transcriptional regulator